MLMRGIITIGVLLALAACTKLAPLPPIPEATRCSPPLTCTQPNGTGVYTDEDGYAGIGPTQLMITHFINNGTSVAFQGVHLEIGATSWTPLPADGEVLGADDGTGKTLDVRAVEERDTAPTWTLWDRAAGHETTVAGEAIARLTLFIRFATSVPTSEQYAIDFAGPPIRHNDRSVHTVVDYPMHWRPRDRVAAPQPYCHAAPPPGATAASLGPDDSVVFQQGIDVDPVTGRVTRVGSHVTLSCYLGAPATVYRRWGYAHTAAPYFYFESAIQMKRASYCADRSHFTVSGTEIAVSDDQVGQGNHQRFPRLEASWSPTGARCIIRDNLRHPSPRFGGVCNSTTLPECPDAPHPAPWLDDSLPP